MATYFTDDGGGHAVISQCSLGIPVSPSYCYAPPAKKRYVVYLLYDKSVLLYNPRFGLPMLTPPLDTLEYNHHGQKQNPMTCLLGTSGSCVYIEQTFLDKNLHVEHTMTHCFDTQSWQWTSYHTPMRRSKTVHTLGSCSATDGHHVYVAGGAQRTASMTRFQQLNNVDRMDVRTLQWEALPDMKQKREGASMVVLQRRIYVIGGQTNDSSTCNSGEVWDPESGGEWTLVPELCPMEVFGTGLRPKVAVVMEALYAINKTSLEVMRYEDSAKVWTCIGHLPAITQHCTSCCPWSCHEVLAMGQELWVVLICLCPNEYATDHMRVSFMTFACLPTSQPLSWSSLPDVTNLKAQFTSTIELNA